MKRKNLRQFAHFGRVPLWDFGGNVAIMQINRKIQLAIKNGSQ